MSNSGTLQGKAALITGGSRGIGAAIVRRFAKEGAAVAFTYSSATPAKADEVVRSVEAAGGKALAIKADSAEVSAVQGAVEEAVKTLGHLDIFVNNAGIFSMSTIDQVSLIEFDFMLAVNVRAAFIGIQAAAAHLPQGGRIITIGSVVAERSAFPGVSVYGMTKAAIVGLVRGIAIDLAPRGITVNNVQPGPIATDMNPTDSEWYEPMRQTIPLKRFGADDEVASLVTYLAGPESSFITGASLSVDGGYTA